MADFSQKNRKKCKKFFSHYYNILEYKWFKNGKISFFFRHGRNSVLGF